MANPSKDYWQLRNSGTSEFNSIWILLSCHEDDRFPQSTITPNYEYPWSSWATRCYVHLDQVLYIYFV